MKNLFRHFSIFFGITTIFYSCITQKYARKDYNKDDISLFGFNQRDTVLDIEGRDLFFCNNLFSQDSSLYFYLSHKYSDGKADENIISKYSQYNKLLTEKFTESISLVNSVDDSIFLKSNCVDKILLTKINFHYINLDKIIKESKRLLKPNGVLIVSISTIDGNRNTKRALKIRPDANETNIISYFEEKGFQILKKKIYTSKKKAGQYMIFIFSKI